MARESATRKVVPYSPSGADRFGIIRTGRYKRIPPRVITKQGGMEVPGSEVTLNLKNFAEHLPQLANAAKMAAEARLMMYGLPDTEMDKFHGWIEDPNYNAELLARFPEQLRDQVDYSSEGRFYKLKPESKVLDAYDPEQVALIMKSLGENFPEGIPPKTALKHVLKSDVPAGTQFYPSTNQYLDDVLFAGGFADDDYIRKLTYKQAQAELENMLIRDTELPPEKRKYAKNIRKMLKKGDNEDYDQSDIKKHLHPGFLQTEGEFDATPGPAYHIQNFLDPARAAVTQDPELDRKTSEADRWARTVYDVGKLLTLARAPELATTALAKVGVPFAAHPVLTRTGLGAVTGALMSPADYFIGDPLFEKTTGYGVTHHPFDLANVAADAVIGAGLSGAGAAINPIGNARYTARNAMVNQPAGSEALGALKAEAESRGIKPHRMGKLVTKEMLDDELDGVPHNPPRGSGEKSFADRAFSKYDKQYPNAGWRFEELPEPEVSVKNSRIADFIDKESMPEKLPLVEDNTATLGAPKMNREAGVRTVNIGGYEVPVDFHGASPQFMQLYLREHPELAGLSEEFTSNLPMWLNRAVPYGSAERRWFGNGPIVMRDTERRKVSSALSESGNRADKAKLEYMQKKGELGNVDEKGRFSGADETQSTAYDKAKQEYKLRKNLRELTPEEIAMYKGGHVRGPLRRGADVAITGIVRPGIINYFPTGSFIADKLTGSQTIPYSYEAYPEEK